MKNNRSKIASFLVLAVLVIGSAGCAVDPINDLQTFDLSSRLACGLDSSLPTGVDTSWTFKVSLAAELDSNRTQPKLIHGATVSRILLYGSPTYPLTNLSNARLYIASDSMVQTLVGQLATFSTGMKLQADITPTMAAVAAALHDSVVVFTLQAHITSAPAESDTIVCRPTLTLIVEPTVAP